MPGLSQATAIRHKSAVIPSSSNGRQTRAVPKNFRRSIAPSSTPSPPPGERYCPLNFRYWTAWRAFSVRSEKPYSVTSKSVISGWSVAESVVAELPDIDFAFNFREGPMVDPYYRPLYRRMKAERAFHLSPFTFH